MRGDFQGWAWPCIIGHRKRVEVIGVFAEDLAAKHRGIKHLALTAYDAAISENRLTWEQRAVEPRSGGR
jgi:hypothetical protein